MKTDRELLELAARAACLDLEWCDFWKCMAKNLGVIDGFDRNTCWNPLTDDGDALRLAVKLKITLDFRSVSERVPSHMIADLPKTKRWWTKGGLNWVSVEYVPEEMWTTGEKEDVRFANWYMQQQSGMSRGIEAATRRAIVRAAAEIQLQKEREQ